MVSTVERYGWAVLMAALMVFAIPWFLWSDPRVVFGLPIWLWWHILWMVVAAVAFWLFSKRAWGIGIVDTDGETA